MALDLLGLARAGAKRALRYLNFSVRSRKAGGRVKIPLVRGMGFAMLRKHEPQFDGLLRALLSDGGAVVDVGTNLGQTLLKVRAIGSDIPYYGFEPNINCCWYVHELIRLNGYSNCHLLPVGLSDGMRIGSFLSDGEVMQAATVVERFRQSSFYESRESVLLLDGDRALELLNAKDVSVLKIDVEGGELEALQGFDRTVGRWQPAILCEILPVYDESTEQGSFRLSRQRAVEEYIGSHGMRMYRILDSGGLRRLSSIEVHGDMSLTNYVFVPPRRSELVRALVVESEN